jgi:pyrroline-5-carboxylate reductase
MAEAILSRLLAVGRYSGAQVRVSDPLPARQDYLHQRYGVEVTGDNSQIAGTDILLLAIKPQIFASATAALVVPPSTLVISILAGISLAQLEAVFNQQPVIRTMPNTPATVGAGITALVRGHRATDNHYAQAEQIFQAVGQVVSVSEAQIDGVTGLSGSGPAYVALVVEALADGGVAAGLPRQIAQQLALQTVLGTAQLLDQENLHPAICKDRVTSPGGTTIAGIRALERSGLRSALIEAVVAAAQRSQELRG